MADSPETMFRPLRVLIVEDVKSDVTLLLLALHEGGFEVSYEAVATQAAMRTALRNQQWDVITSDHHMLQFGGPAALTLAQELSPNVPFVIVSGEIELDLAVGLMKAGALDYVQKKELARLVPVIERALVDREARNAKVLANEALISSEVQYRRLFETAQDGILIVDAETGRIQDVNPFLLDLLGFSREEYLGKQLWEVAAFDDSEASKPPFLELQKKGYIRQDNIPLRAKAGSRIHVEFISNIYEVGKEKVIQCNIRDITERRQADETRDRLAAIVESSDDAIISKDLDGTILDWNHGAEKVFGYSVAEMMGKSTQVLLPPNRIHEEAEILARIRRGERVDHFETTRVRKDGRKIDVSVTVSPTRDSDGAISGASKIARDITQRKADELEIRKLNQDLEERIVKRTTQLQAANRDLEAFSYSVSHDLRAPLRHVTGFSKILIERFGPVMAAEAREYLQHIEDSVHRMERLVDALLNLAKLGPRSLCLCRTDLNAIVDEVIRQLQPECEGREVEWHIARLPALECDPVLMHQVLQNLLSNAVKYSRGRTPAVIEVDSVQQSGKPAAILVRDNGAGFDTKHAERLFGVFQRLHTESEFEGTGVGLATAQRIIQKHGGAIWAEAEVDHGASFYFTVAGNDHAGQVLDVENSRSSVFAS